ncbi:MAG: RNA polymerase sigma factor [Bacteroidota bacterium]
MTEVDGCMERSDFAKALEQHISPLRNYAMWLTKDHEEAQDLTQETLASAFVNHHRYVFNGSFSAWLRRILFNKYVNQRKRAKRMSSMEDMDQHTIETILKETDPLQNLIALNIEEEIQKLEDRYRLPMLLRIRGFKYHEIALKLDIPIGTVKNRIFEARQVLLKKLSHDQ